MQKVFKNPYTQRWGLRAYLCYVMWSRLRRIGINVMLVKKRPLTGVCAVSDVPGFRVLETDASHLLTRPSSDRQQLELNEPFLASAQERGDRCFAVLHNERPVGCTWFSAEDTPAEAGFCVRVRDSDRRYEYKAFTRKDYRGRGLHGLLKARSRRILSEEGIRTVLSYARVENLASHRANQKGGGATVGFVVLFRVGRARVAVHSPGTRAVGLRFYPAD